MKFRNSDAAFASAIEQGALSDNPKAPNYAGNWMYMGSKDHGDEVVEVNISCWTARKLDKTTTEEVCDSKNAASKDAARVNKSLLAGRTELKDIEKIAGEVRTYLYANSMPWSNNGLQLLPTAKFMVFDAQMRTFEQKFHDAVQSFIAIYPTLITAQAMALGDMFNRDDFPLPETLASKFAFTVGYMPVPASGDFRVDVGIEAQEELKVRLEQVTQDRINAALTSVWEKLGEHVKRMSKQLTVEIVNGEEKKGKIYDSLLGAAWDLVDSIKDMNIVNDPTLEAARKDLEQVIKGLTTKDLKDAGIKKDVKKEVDKLLSKFSF